jgi:Tol biopolymer transport system component
MFKRLKIWGVAAVFSVTVLLPAMPASAAMERRIVFTSGLDGHVISVNADGSDRRDYGPGHSPKLSPDGTKIAFGRDGADASVWDLYVADADGSNVVKVSDRIYTMASPATQFSWSPDGAKIAHTVEYGVNPGDAGGEHKQIAVVNADGTGKVQLTNEPANTWNINPVWSPDGSKILYSRLTNTSEIYMMDGSGANQHLVVANASDGSWSPDATKILFSETGVGVRTADVHGGNRTTLTTVGLYASWSPDGSRVLFESPECDCSMSPSAIVTVKPDGTDRKVHAVPPTAGGVGQPAWSPDSASVIFTEWARWESPRLVKKAVSGGDGTIVVNESAGNPQWAYLAFIGDAPDPEPQPEPQPRPEKWEFNFNFDAELQAKIQAYIAAWISWSWRAF